MENERPNSLPEYHLRRGKLAHQVAVYGIGPLAAALTLLRLLGALSTSWWLIAFLWLVFIFHSALVGVYFAFAQLYEYRKRQNLR